MMLRGGAAGRCRRSRRLLCLWTTILRSTTIRSSRSLSSSAATSSRPMRAISSVLTPTARSNSSPPAPPPPPSPPPSPSPASPSLRHEVRPRPRARARAQSFPSFAFVRRVGSRVRVLAGATADTVAVEWASWIACFCDTPSVCLPPRRQSSFRV